MGVVWPWWVWPEWVGWGGRGLLLTPLPQELAAQQEEAELECGPAPPGPPNDYKDKYRHLIGSDAAKAAARTMEANKAYGCGEQRVPRGSRGSSGSGCWAAQGLGCPWGAGGSLRAVTTWISPVPPQCRWPTSGTRAPSKRP